MRLASRRRRVRSERRPGPSEQAGPAKRTARQRDMDTARAAREAAKPAQPEKTAPKEKKVSKTRPAQASQVADTTKKTTRRTTKKPTSTARKARAPVIELDSDTDTAANTTRKITKKRTRKTAAQPTPTMKMSAPSGPRPVYDLVSDTDSDKDDAAPSPSKTRGTKRGAEDEPAAPPPAKRGRSTGARRGRPAAIKTPTTLNAAPSERLNVFVCGTGSLSELGLGVWTFRGMSPTEARVPVLNHRLSGALNGVVQVAAGDAHGVALTHDATVRTWGIDHEGALGRARAPAEEETASDYDFSDQTDHGLRPVECTPLAIAPDAFGGSPVAFCQLAATDNATFALTDDGDVYRWGNFKVGLLSELFPEHSTDLK